MRGSVWWALTALCVTLIFIFIGSASAYEYQNDTGLPFLYDGPGGAADVGYSVLPTALPNTSVCAPGTVCHVSATAVVTSTQVRQVTYVPKRPVVRVICMSERAAVGTVRIASRVVVRGATVPIRLAAVPCRFVRRLLN